MDLRKQKDVRMHNFCFDGFYALACKRARAFFQYPMKKSNFLFLFWHLIFALACKKQGFFLFGGTKQYAYVLFGFIGTEDALP
ncbi:MAG: hypothetical protein HY842_14225 [Bacteroidetes bacterium]|nr:hypothetical protein [Bacteroidota bacterium]